MAAFEVLDNLRTKLMEVVFELEEIVDKDGTIRLIRECWSRIYRIAGLNSNISSEVLRFAATLKKRG